GGVGDAGCAERDLYPRGVVPEVLPRCSVVGALRRVRGAVWPDKDEADRGRERRVVTIAGRRHADRPGDLVRGDVHRLQVAASVRALVGRACVTEALDDAVAELRAEVRLSGDPLRKLARRVRGECGVAVVAADVLVMRLRAVARRLPVRPTFRSRRVHDVLLVAVWREDAGDLVRLAV